MNFTTIFSRFKENKTQSSQPKSDLAHRQSSNNQLIAETRKVSSKNIFTIFSWKKNTENVSKSIIDKYSDLRDEREKKRKQIIKKKKVPVIKKLKIKNIIFTIFVIIGGVGLYFLYNFIQTSEFFEIEQIDVIHNGEHIDSTFVEMVGLNLFSTKNVDLIEIVQATNNQVSDVYVQKVLPNKVIISYETSNYLSFLITFEGTYLINEDLQIVDTISDETFTLNTLEQRILQSDKDLNASFLVQAYVDTLEPEDKERFSWGELDIQVKEDFYNSLVDQTRQRIVEFFETQEARISETGIILPVVVTENTYFDYNVELQPTIELYNEVKSLGLHPVSVYWKDPLRLEFNLDNNSVLVFYTQESTNSQIERLHALIASGKLENKKIFDLRTEVFIISDTISSLE